MDKIEELKLKIVAHYNQATERSNKANERGAGQVVIQSINGEVAAYSTVLSIIEGELKSDSVIDGISTCSRCTTDPRHGESIYCINCLYEKRMTGY